MKLKNTTALIIACTAFATSSVAATDLNIPESYYYMQLNGGLAYGLTGAGMFGNKNAGNTGMYGVEAGYKFDDYTRASISADYMPNHSFNSAAEGTSGLIGGQPYAISSNNNFKVNAWLFMLNGYYDIKNSSSFTPYFTLGAGVSRNKAQSTYTSTGSLNGVSVYNSSSNLAQGTKDNFAYKFGAGVRYNVHKNIDLDLRYQFIDMGNFTTASGASIAAQTVKIKTQELLLGVAYKF